jgi:hypothetical protein
MPELRLELHLTPADLLKYYRGDVRVVQARALTGQTVQFPASALQRHVTAEGVHGLFRIEFDAAFKFRAFDRVATR